MDRIDRNILAELQKDGRLSITELAERVGLSLSPCHRRVRALEESGVLLGYRAKLDPIALGLTFSAMVFVTLREGDRTAVEAFENALVALPQVVDAQRLFGEPDYLLHVITQDLPAFQRLYDESLSSLPNVQRLTSTPCRCNLAARLQPHSGAPLSTAHPTNPGKATCGWPPTTAWWPGRSGKPRPMPTMPTRY